MVLPVLHWNLMDIIVLYQLQVNDYWIPLNPWQTINHFRIYQSVRDLSLDLWPQLGAGNQGTLDKILASSMFDNDTFFIALSENQSNVFVRRWTIQASSSVFCLPTYALRSCTVRSGCVLRRAVGPNCKKPTKNKIQKIRQIDKSYLCLQRFDKFEMWNGGNRKRNLCKQLVQIAKTHQR